MSPLPVWQVTLCDPIWHVSFRSGEANCCKLLYSVYLLTYLLSQQAFTLHIALHNRLSFYGLELANITDFNS